MRLSRPSLNFLNSISRDYAKKAPRAILGEPTIPSKPHVLARDTSVILFGWAGAREKHVAKHAELYHDRGFKTLSFTSAFDGRHPLYLKLNISGLLPELKKIADDPTRRFLIHTYSMNGVFTLCTLLYRKGFTDFLKRTDGLAMDSGPVYFKEVTAYTLVLESIFTDLTNKMGPAQKAIALIYKHFLGLIMLFAHLRAKALHLFFRKPMTELDAFTFMKVHPDIPKQQAYFFSDKDVICRANMIMEFIDWQLARGKEVTYLNFGNAEHVAHLKADPAKYGEVLDKYLDKVAIERGLMKN
ncbi:unnamed protein product, partial [Mesorhabditis belari]|uniref:Transmembrane protein 53 n=1 Tax=Mesorhabditis belari TaxID=2138241 RepID=A0AAF3F5L0_9BILA